MPPRRPQPRRTAGQGPRRRPTRTPAGRSPLARASLPARVEDQDQKHSGESGATSGDPRQSGGRAYRDPFDAVHRSEITPNEPTNGKSRTPLASAPPVLGPRRPSSEARRPEATGCCNAARRARSRGAAEMKSAAPKQSPAKQAPAVEAPRDEVRRQATAAAATPLTPPAREAPVEVKPADPRQALASPPQAVEPARSPPKRGRPPQPKAAWRLHSERRQQAEGSRRPRRCRATGGCHQAGGCRGRAGLATQHRGDRHAGRRADQPDRRLRVRHVRHRLRRSAAGHDRRHGQDREAAPDPPEPLVIRGHTDRRPYRTATYDNWRLSAARAHMAYVMLARSGVDEKRFERIEGHADRSLRVQHDPEAAQNRRIEILLRK